MLREIGGDIGSALSRHQRADLHDAEPPPLLSVDRVTVTVWAEATVDVISAVERACLAGADAALHAGGFVPEPQLHMLIDDWDQPYVGYVRTRPSQRNEPPRVFRRLGLVGPASG
jgi:hypothetical protein